MRCFSPVILTSIACAALAGPLAAQGRVVEDSVRSAALQGNPLGERPVRRFRVYLPPAYDTDPTVRYPVVYLLHDFGESADRWTGSSPGLAGIMDRLIGAGTIRPMIVVLPEDRTVLGSSGYTNSPTTGAWETYFARDLVRHVDVTYRTFRRGASRGLAGYGSGGSAAFRLGMRFPGGVGAIYGLSPWLSSPCDGLDDDAVAQLVTATRMEDAATLPRPAQACLAEAAAWSPDSTSMPFHAALPFTRAGGRTVADTVARERWEDWALAPMAPRYRDGLVRLRGIGFEAGRNDPDFSAAVAFDSLLTRLRVRHQFTAFDGTAGGQLDARLAETVLPFFSATLDFNPDTH